LDQRPNVALSAFQEWNSSPVLWKARASLVPFAQSKTLANYEEIVLSFSKVLIQREERFCKTAVGWVLRQYSKIDPKVVTTFLDDYSEWTTREVVKNATKYLS
jgi:3-methyladenine DNA glycosylase AlkD